MAAAKDADRVFRGLRQVQAFLCLLLGNHVLQQGEFETYNATNSLMQVASVLLLHIRGEGAAFALIEAANAPQVSTREQVDKAAMTGIECLREAVIARHRLYPCIR